MSEYSCTWEYDEGMMLTSCRIVLGKVILIERALLSPEIILHGDESLPTSYDELEAALENLRQHSSEVIPADTIFTQYQPLCESCIGCPSLFLFYKYLETINCKI